MAVINRNAPRSYELIRLADRLREVQEIAEYLSAVNGTASDADITAVYGVPSGDVAAYKTVVGSLETALQDNAVENFIKNVL